MNEGPTGGRSRPFAEQVRHDRHPVEPGHFLRRLAFLKIGLHGRYR
jgi:hypothetical protein